jgi:threonine dehydratase
VTNKDCAPLPTLIDIEQAAVRIAPYIHQTPLMRSRQIEQLAGCRLTFKCETLQKSGAFKARGASNAVLQLSEQAAALGVATHSSGNHGAALAMAARNRGIPAYVVVPSSAPAVKKQAILGYGAELIRCEPTLAARLEMLEHTVARTGAQPIPPYDHSDIISGQGTVALELHQQLGPDTADMLITPVGGGGLLAGSAIASKSLQPACQVIGAEPAGADDAYRSFHSGQRVTEHIPESIADGLLTTLGVANFNILRHSVDTILRVEEQQIIDAMQLIWSRLKLVVEPSAAVPLAAVMAHRSQFAGRHVAIILSGGNVDLAQLPW